MVTIGSCVPLEVGVWARCTCQLLTGTSPFLGNMQQVMYQHLQVLPKPPSSINSRIPPAVDDVILRALAKKPEDRFPSVQAFATAFEQA